MRTLPCSQPTPPACRRQLEIVRCKISAKVGLRLSQRPEKSKILRLLYLPVAVGAAGAAEVPEMGAGFAGAFLARRLGAFRDLLLSAK